MSVARMIEVAEHNGFYEDGVLIVFDGLVNDRYNGVRLEVSETTAVPGWHALARDGVGNAQSVWVPASMTREDAVTKALDGYLRIVNVGI